MQIDTNWLLMLAKKSAMAASFLLASLLLSSCDKVDNTQLTAKQIAEDQKRYTQEVQRCFLNNYAEVEDFHQPTQHIAFYLRQKCSDEFAALRAAMLNYVMVRDVIEPPPKIIQEELKMSGQFIELARNRARAMFKHPPIFGPNSNGQNRGDDLTPYHKNKPSNKPSINLQPGF